VHWFVAKRIVQYPEDIGNKAAAEKLFPKIEVLRFIITVHFMIDYSIFLYDHSAA
jgi:hypothetical protein